jgi:hypothetical protein
MKTLQEGYENLTLEEMEAKAAAMIPRLVAAMNIVYGEGTMEIVYEGEKIIGLRCMKKFKQTPEARVRIAAILGAMRESNG